VHVPAWREENLSATWIISLMRHLVRILHTHFDNYCN
jgi:hypothetical protein